MISVSDRLHTLNERIGQACQEAGRPRESVRLLAVSKLQSDAAIREAARAGQLDFGENYVQEAAEKIAGLKNMALNWHFIGRIQTNKIRALVTENFAYIHSVDSARVLEKIMRFSHDLGRVQKIFLQIHVGEEATKGGASAEELKTLIAMALRAQALSVQGLMVMPPLNEDPRPYFAQTRQTLENIRAMMSPAELGRHPMDQLSMGTSLDFKQAILEGATWIRVGTDVFGARAAEPGPRFAGEGS
jgi:pyridoxal phosphate enzyme (YggS family)